MQKQMYYLVFLVFWSTIAVAETDLLNLSSYQEGDTPAYGQYVVVKQDEKTGVKWITGTEYGSSGNMGRLKYAVNLAGDFELFLKAENRIMEFFLIANDEYKIRLDLSGSRGDLYANSTSAGKDESNAWSSNINEVKLVVVNNVAKLYANDVFSQKVSLRPDMTYTQLLVNLDTRDELYALKIGGSGATTTTDSTTADTPNQCPTTVSNPSTAAPTATVLDSNACLATYSFDGRVHIPCIAVPDLFGGITVYDLQMQQQSSGFTFELDMGTVKPR